MDTTSYRVLCDFPGIMLSQQTNTAVGQLELQSGGLKSSIKPYLGEWNSLYCGAHNKNRIPFLFLENALIPSDDFYCNAE